VGKKVGEEEPDGDPHARLEGKNIALRRRLGGGLGVEPLAKDYGMSARCFLELKDNDP
jgi:hypothetical protein